MAIKAIGSALAMILVDDAFYMNGMLHYDVTGTKSMVINVGDEVTCGNRRGVVVNITSDVKVPDIKYFHVLEDTSLSGDDKFVNALYVYNVPSGYVGSLTLPVFEGIVYHEKNVVRGRVKVLPSTTSTNKTDIYKSIEKFRTKVLGQTLPVDVVGNPYKTVGG